MKGWLALLSAIGAGFFALCVWRRRWLAQEAQEIDAEIAVRGQTLIVRRQGQKLDEGLRASAAARNAAFEFQRKKAAQIASGTELANGKTDLRRVK